MSHGLGLILNGWVNPPPVHPPLLLPLEWLPVLIIPIALAIYGYGRAITQLTRARSAWHDWLVGLTGHLVYLAGGTLVGGLNPAALPTSSLTVGILLILLPGFLLRLLKGNGLQRNTLADG